MPMCKTVDHCYEGGSETVVDRYHSGNNLGTGLVLFQYYNVYWVIIFSFERTEQYCWFSIFAFPLASEVRTP